MASQIDETEKKTAYAALLEIRRILSDPALSDAECIEQICRVYESLGDMPKADRGIRAHTTQK